MTITSRPYRDDHDYALMSQLVREIYRIHGPPVYCTAGDLDWWRSDEPAPDMLAAQLWFDEQQLVGFAWPLDEQIDLISHPAAAHLEAEMLDWAEEGRRVALGTQKGTARAWAFLSDVARSQLLLSRGYIPQMTALQLLTRPLIEAPAMPTIAPGYCIRAVRLPEELLARAELHQNAFAPSRMTTRRYEVVMRMPTYDMSLDIVAEAPDGSLAAFCTVWWDAENRMGVFEPVGCHSEHRRRGLAAAVMIEGIRRLVALGATVAHVTTGRGNNAAQALYASLGFHLLDENVAYDRMLNV